VKYIDEYNSSKLGLHFDGNPMNQKMTIKVFSVYWLPLTASQRWWFSCMLNHVDRTFWMSSYLKFHLNNSKDAENTYAGIKQAAHRHGHIF